MSVVLVLCTFPDSAKARQIGTLLVERQLAACVNLVPGIESIYRWQGEVAREAEVLAIFKTTGGMYAEFAGALAALHPYDVPEIISIQPRDVAEKYAEWVMGSVRGLPDAHGI